MQNRLITLVLAVISMLPVAHAQAAEVQEIDSTASVFLGSPSVTRTLLEATESEGRTVLVDRIVTQPTLAIGYREHSTELCVQLDWHGGDVIGTFGALSGKVLTRSYGRGVAYEVVDVKLELNVDQNTRGRCAE